MTQGSSSLELANISDANHIVRREAVTEGNHWFEVQTGNEPVMKLVGYRESRDSVSYRKGSISRPEAVSGKEAKPLNCRHEYHETGRRFDRTVSNASESARPAPAVRRLGARSGQGSQPQYPGDHGG